VTDAQSSLAVLRVVLAQDESLPALRAVLFLFGAAGAFAWSRRRVGLSLLTLVSGGLIGLSYWLVQIEAPLGLGTDPILTRQWAQAGVSAQAESSQAGFIWGTSAEGSLLAGLASAGLPLWLVHLTPQFAVLLGYTLTILAPWLLMRNRMSALWAAALFAGGGLWPDLAAFGALALKPSILGIVFPGIVIATFLRRTGRLRRTLHVRRVACAAGLIALAALARAFQGGIEANAISWLCLTLLTLMLAPRLRTGMRLISRTRTGVLRLESALLLCVFCGGSVFWWNPPRSLPGFREAREGGVTLGRPLRFISENVPVEDVVLASPDYSAPIAALSGRRVLFAPRMEGEPALPGPPRRVRLLSLALEGRPPERLADLFSVTHLLLGPGEPTPASQDNGVAADPEAMGLVPVYQDAKDFRVFRLVKKK
jgi:hypothetical protein